MDDKTIDEIIRVDLHIHSYISKYKENEVNGFNIVEKSTIQNLPNLLDTLEENKINMFSFSDHNRFDKNLFIEARNLLLKNSYKYLKNILPSVEFDVQLEKNHDSCHILTIFDYKNEEDLTRISTINDNGIIKDKDDFYSISKFESTMKSIGLSTIFIACQRKSINNPNGGSNCFNDSVSNPYEFLKTGFISALEYQKPQVEGILRNDLREFPKEISFVSGSDCHQWEAYPYHDQKSKPSNHSYFFEIKSEPTFLGLLLAFTSPKTRFNRHINNKVGLLESFSINNKNHKLSKGINAIIGENGSGKSTLLNGLSNNLSNFNYMKKILNDNDFTKQPNELDAKYRVITQNELIKNDNGQIKGGTIFGSDGKFNPLNNQEFRNSSSRFLDKLWSKIQLNININNLQKELKEKTFQIKPEYEERKKYFISFINNEKNELTNNAEDHLKNLNNILLKVKEEIKSDFYDENQRKKLKQSFDIINSVRNAVKKEYEALKAKKMIISIISGEINTYTLKINDLSSAEERSINAYNQEKENFIVSIECMCKAIKKEYYEDLSKINIETHMGQSERIIGEFKFLTTAKYYEFKSEDIKKELLASIFNKDFQDIQKVLGIKDEKTLADSIKRDQQDPQKSFYQNANKRIEELCKESKCVICTSESSNNILGYTLGQKSIMYYRFITFAESNLSLLFIDQPEDNLSNKNVIFKLRDYLNALRDKNIQIFIVTHNPMLVVNLDVDNVISCKMINGKLDIISGPLEGKGVLKEILEIMDGSKEEIEKRVKLYENS